MNNPKAVPFALPIVLLIVGILSGCVTTRTVLVESKPPAASVLLDGTNEGQTPLSKELTWSEKDVHTVSVEAKDFESQSKRLTFEDARLATDPWEIQFDLQLLVERVEIDITANVDGANVSVDDVFVGRTPLRHTFVFRRSDSESPWSKHLVVVSKNGYRYRPRDIRLPPGANPPFSCQLEVNSSYISENRIHVLLENVRFYRTPIRRLVYSGEGVQIEEEIVLSQVGEIEREPKVQSVTKITDAKPSDAFMESRVAVMPNGESIVYSFPYRIHGRQQEFLNLWMQHGHKKTRLTDAEKRDFEATVSPDGNWVYFSSNRLDPERYNLWRIRTEGRGGLTKITDSPSSRVDTEPAVSPDGSEIAYTSYLIAVKPPHIWVANADGTLPTQLRVGKSPCWSPDGQKIAFVGPDSSANDRIWVMNADGSNPTQLTTGDFHDRYPVWAPDGTRIIYASNQSLNEEEQHNYDLWIMNTDGTGRTQLTINGSYDSRPAASPDGRFIYFVSNRGAQTEAQQALQIWRIQLPQ
jgi:hypothetical protein